MEMEYHCVPTGTQFQYMDEIWVKIPEMILKCGEYSFLIGCIRVIPSKDDYKPPTYSAETLYPTTIVKVL